MSAYSITQVSEQTDLSPHTLRYYEKSGLLPDIPKNSSGRRSYREVDLRVIKFIKALRGTGMRINQIKEYGDLYLQGAKKTKERKALLEQHREKILTEIKTQKKYLKIIEAKIETIF